MTENQHALWLLSRPACAEVILAMQEFTGVNYNTGEQNKDMTAARQASDWNDTLTVLQYLQERNPFSLDPSLRSISTGVHAHPTVNVDEAVAVGDMILTQMNGNTPVLVGEDTDLIILLCYHANLDSHDIFFHSEPKKKHEKISFLECQSHKIKA